MAINYDQDIAPLRQQYFPMLMGERGFDQAMKYRQETLMPMQMHTMKLEQHQMASESHRMSQETQSFRLEESRRRAKDEAEAHQMIPDFVDAQLGLANDPSKDPFEKAQGIAALYSQLPSFALTNPAVSAVFGAANSITQSQFNAEKYQQDQFERRQKLQLDQDNKREAERTKVMEAYATSGNVKALEEMLSSGPSSLMGEAYLSLAQSTEGRARLAQAKNTAEQRDAEEKARFDVNMANKKLLDSMEISESGDDYSDEAKMDSQWQTINTMLRNQYGIDHSQFDTAFEARRAALKAATQAMGGTSAVIESSASKISGSMGL
jgi:hypothetical protein